MTGTPWWATALVGLLAAVASVVGTTYATRKTFRQSVTATRLGAEAARREEWFRRVQWATGLAMSGTNLSRRAGFLALRILSDSALADADDLELLGALSEVDPFIELSGSSGATMDDTQYLEDDDG